MQSRASAGTRKLATLGLFARVLTALLGEENVAGPGFDTLAATFGLQDLIGKSLAIVGEARN